MSYIPTTWQDGDAITASKLNKISGAVEARAVNPFLGSNFTADQVQQIIELGMIPVVIIDNSGSSSFEFSSRFKSNSSSNLRNWYFDYINMFWESGAVGLFGSQWETSSTGQMTLYVENNNNGGDEVIIKGEAEK